MCCRFLTRARGKSNRQASQPRDTRACKQTHKSCKTRTTAQNTKKDRQANKKSKKRERQAASKKKTRKMHTSRQRLKSTNKPPNIAQRHT